MEQAMRTLFHISVFKIRGWVVFWHSENTNLPSRKNFLKHFNENKLKVNPTR
jgi:hypothetical protein